MDQNFQESCCPYANATCCGLGQNGIGPFCCPSGQECDPINNVCVANDTSKNCTNCLAAMELIIKTNGCNCPAFPSPLSAICAYMLQEAGSCAVLLDLLQSSGGPLDLCEAASYCASNSGQCVSVISVLLFFVTWLSLTIALVMRVLHTVQCWKVSLTTKHLSSRRQRISPDR